MSTDAGPAVRAVEKCCELLNGLPVLERGFAYALLERMMDLDTEVKNVALQGRDNSIREQSGDQ